MKIKNVNEVINIINPNETKTPTHTQCHFLGDMYKTNNNNKKLTQALVKKFVH